VQLTEPGVVVDAIRTVLAETRVASGRSRVE